MSDWNPLNWAKSAWDVTGADSLFKFGQNVGEGKWGDAGKQIGRGVKTAWNETPANEIWNISRDTGQALSGQKKWSDVLGTVKRDLPSGFLDIMNITPGIPLGKTFRLAARSPLTRRALGRIGKDLVLGGIISGGFNAISPTGSVNAATTATSPSGGYGSSAAERRRKEEDDMEYYRSRIDAQNANTIEPFPEVIPPMGAPTTGTSGVAGAAPGGLVGLTPDQTYQIAMQDRLLQKQYDELLNQLALQEKQATLDTATSRYGIQREAATSGQDLATQLAAAGMDFSPASAIGAEQLVQGNRIQQEAAASKNLANILSEIKQAKVKAKGDMDLGKLLNQIDRGRQQVSNTIANVGGYYNRIGGQ